MSPSSVWRRPCPRKSGPIVLAITDIAAILVYLVTAYIIL
jgi:hypothetical protein